MPHTPGPWKVHDRWYIGTDGEGIRTCTHAEVKCCVNVPASDEEQHEANARLIAAAPALLAACKESIGHVGHTLDCPTAITGNFPNCTCRVRRMHDAIAAAEMPHA